jgi:hypothetical protein
MIKKDNFSTFKNKKVQKVAYMGALFKFNFVIKKLTDRFPFKVTSDVKVVTFGRTAIIEQGGGCFPNKYSTLRLYGSI